MARSIYVKKIESGCFRVQVESLAVFCRLEMNLLSDKMFIRQNGIFLSVQTLTDECS